ncbi:hypothetical protein B7494_g2348 [Chlorociboria aeruginascens]|nr:hypothetical protein B7494_g2348 [Chlorociboria aeruginascens]
MFDIENFESQIEYVRAELACFKWLIERRDRLRKGYPKKEEFNKSASKGRNFNALFDKYFTGEDWEIKILRTLRLDIFIRLCLLLVPTEFDEILDKGLQNAFAEKMNKGLDYREIPLWAAGKASNRIAKSKSNSESPEAKKLLEGLQPYLSQSTRRSGKTSTTRSQSPTSVSIVDRPQGLLPKSTGEVSIPPGYGILWPDISNINIHRITNDDPLPPASSYSASPSFAKVSQNRFATENEESAPKRLRVNDNARPMDSTSGRSVGDTTISAFIPFHRRKNASK